MYGFEEPAWLARLDAERDNARVALGWAVERGEAETALRLGAALFWFWFTRHTSEGRGWLDRALAAEGDAAPAVRARALFAAGGLAWWVEGDIQRAEPPLRESLALCRVLGDKRGAAEALIHLGQVALRRGDLDRAAALAAEGLALGREIGHAIMVGGSLMNLAMVARARGDVDRARALLAEGLASFRHGGFRWGTAWGLHRLAELAREQGAAAIGIALYGESMAAYSEAGDAWSAAEALGDLATAAAEGGQFEAAARLFGATGARREAIGVPDAPVDRERYEGALARTGAALGERSFADAWAAGRQLSLEETLAEVSTVAAKLASASTAPSPAAAPSLPGGLSAREAEVLRLVARGLTNPQVAERLFLSPRTVEAHLRRVYDKLDVATRAEAVRFAVEHGLR